MGLINLFRKTRSAIGFDLGGKQVKIAIVETRKGVPTVRQTLMLPLEEGLIAEGRLMDSASVSTRLRSIQDALDVTKSVIVSGSGAKGVFVTLGQTPRAPKGKALEMVLTDPELGIPMKPAENPKLDMHILDPEGAGDMMQAQVVAARREEILERQMVFYNAMLPVQIIDVDFFALFNTFVACLPDKRFERSMLVHTGYDTTLIVVVDGGQAVYSRIAPIGTRRLKQEIESSGRFGSTNGEEAMLGPDLQAMYTREYSQWVGDLALNVRRAASHAFNEDEDLGEVYVSGGGALIPSMPQMLAQELNAHVQILNPLDYLAHGDDLDESSVQSGPVFALAIGFALRGGQ